MGDVLEAELLDAFRDGRVLDCADGGVRRGVDAGLLRRCCLELRDQIDPRGVRLKSAEVLGGLDLAGLDVPFPLRFEACGFESAPVVEGALLYELAFTGCTELPGLLANGLRIRRDLDLSRSRVAGAHRTSASTSRRSAIWLCESDIGGRLLCVDTVIEPGGERSLQADRMHVGGTVRLLHQFTALGEMRLLGARIDGSLDLTGARIEASDGPAMDLGDAIIGGSVFLINDKTGRRPVIRGRLDMGSARIAGQFLVRNATLREPGTVPTDSGYSRTRLGGTAMSAPRLTVGAELTMEGSCEVTGGIDLSMGEMSCLSVGGGCTLRAAGRTALDLSHAEIRSMLVLGAGAAVEGAILLSGAHVHGHLSLQGVALSAPASMPTATGVRTLIAAEGLRADGDVDLRNLRATGGALRFRNAALGGTVNAVGARLANPDGYTLSLYQATVNSTVHLGEDFESHGLVVLSQSTIGGRLECARGSFTGGKLSTDSQRDHAIEAISATIRGGMDLGWTVVSPSVDFTNATTTFLADNPANWPQRFTISGFTYDRFEEPQRNKSGLIWNWAARRTWLSHQAIYDSGPYEQAARVFRQHGYASGAEQILIAQRRQAYHGAGNTQHLIRKVIDRAYGASIGYGYRPGRVLWLLAVLLILVVASLEIPAGQATLRSSASASAVYTTSGPLRPARSATALPSAPAGTRGTAKTSAPDSCGDGQIRCFNPVLYAIDTVVPLVSLDQRSAWYPDARSPDGWIMEWWLNMATLLGWLLSSIFVLSLARLARTA